MQQTLEVALRAAAAGSRVLREHWATASQVSFKGPVDLVTDADLAAERAVVEMLRKEFPDHGIVAEESDPQGECDGKFRWYVDPLDGTTNFAHRFPHFAVSIALVCEGEVVLGVVKDPMRDEVFAAARGQGATLNGMPIHVSRTEALGRALLGTGFPYDRQQRAAFYLKAVERFLTVGQGIRRGGSAALDLSYVACGRLDGFWERALKPWDVAAGSILVEEAGGVLSDFHGGPWTLDGAEILASNGLLGGQMVGQLSQLPHPPP